MNVQQRLPDNYFGTYYGIIKSDEDAARVIEGCIQDRLPLIRSRLNESKRRHIDGGFVFVFKSNSGCEKESDSIQRWTDGKLWSPSKILDNFLIYCELIANYKPLNQSLDYHPDDMQDMEYLNNLSLDPHNELGVINKKYWIDNQKGIFIPKLDGLIKKTLTISLMSGDYHLIAYEFAQLPINHEFPLLTPDNYLELSELKINYLTENLKINRFKKT